MKTVNIVYLVILRDQCTIKTERQRENKTEIQKRQRVLSANWANWEIEREADTEGRLAQLVRASC